MFAIIIFIQRQINSCQSFNTQGPRNNNSSPEHLKMSPNFGSFTYSWPIISAIALGFYSKQLNPVHSLVLKKKVCQKDCVSNLVILLVILFLVSFFLTEKMSWWICQEMLLYSKRTLALLISLSQSLINLLSWNNPVLVVFIN